jgi:hypothetical protein
MSANVGAATPQLSNSCTSYRPIRYTPEFDPLGSMTSSETSRSPCCIVVNRCPFAASVGEFTSTLVPGSAWSARARLRSTVAPPATRQLAAVGRNARRSVSGIDCAGNRPAAGSGGSGACGAWAEAVVSAVADNSAARQSRERRMGRTEGTEGAGGLAVVRDRAGKLLVSSIWSGAGRQNMEGVNR